MLRRVVKDNPMRWVAQKGRPAWLVVQDARRALRAQVEIEIGLGRDPAHQTFRLMDVEIVNHKPPACCGWVTSNHRLHMRQEIRFGAGGATTGCQHLAGHHVAADDKRARAMPNVLKFPPFNFATGQPQTGIFPFQRLDAGQFVRTHRSLALCRACRRVGVDPTHVPNFLIQLIIDRWRQPIADQMRFEIPLLSNRAAWRGEIWPTMPRCLISSATSRPVHWLIGRAESAGGSQAMARIWHSCSAVI